MAPSTKQEYLWQKELAVRACNNNNYLIVWGVEGARKTTLSTAKMAENCICWAVTERRCVQRRRQTRRPESQDVCEVAKVGSFMEMQGTSEFSEWRNSRYRCQNKPRMVSTQSSAIRTSCTRNYTRTLTNINQI